MGGGVASDAEKLAKPTHALFTTNYPLAVPTHVLNTAHNNSSRCAMQLLFTSKGAAHMLCIPAADPMQISK